MDYIIPVKIPAQIFGLFPYTTKNQILTSSKYFSTYSILSIIYLSTMNYLIYHFFIHRPSLVFGEVFLGKVLMINNIVSTALLPFCFYYNRNEIRLILNDVNSVPWSKSDFSNKYYEYVYQSVFSLCTITLHTYLGISNVSSFFGTGVTLAEVQFLVCIMLILAYLKYPELAFEEINHTLQHQIDHIKLREVHVFFMKTMDHLLELDKVFGIATLSIMWTTFIDFLYIQVLVSSHGIGVLNTPANILRVSAFVLDPILLMQGFHTVQWVVSLNSAWFIQKGR